MMISTQSADRKNLALLGACCLFLSAIEYLIPKPLPFMRIGLANLPIMLALDIFTLPNFIVLVCIKVIGQALITGTLFSYVFLFSLAGTFSSALLMYTLRRFFGQKNVSFIGIGVAGAMVSNSAQLMLAWLFIFKENTRYVAPPFLLAGLVMGIVLGFFCEVFTKRSCWYRSQGTGNREQGTGNSACSAKQPACFKSPFLRRRKPALDSNLFSATALFVTGLLVMPAIIFNPSMECRVIQFLFFCVLALLFGRRLNLFLTMAIIIGVVAFNLIIPYGYVLFSIGRFKITSGAFTAGIHRASTVQALVMLSKVSIREDLKIPGAFGELLSESMRIFPAMMKKWKYFISRKNVFSTIDRIMLELSEVDLSAPVTTQIRTKPAGYVILAVFVILSWLCWFIPVEINLF